MAETFSESSETNIHVPVNGAGLENSKLERGKRKMTDDKIDTTSDVDQVEKLIGKELTQVKAQLQVALEEIDSRVTEITNLKLANAKLKDRAESEVKGRLLDEIRKVSNYGIEFLAECSVDRLEQILEDSKMLKTPLFSSSGDFGRGPDPQDKLRNMFKFSKRRE